jgi:hypothetical protein
MKIQTKTINKTLMLATLCMAIFIGNTYCSAAYAQSDDRTLPQSKVTATDDCTPPSIDTLKRECETSCKRFLSPFAASWRSLGGEPFDNIIVNCTGACIYR